MKCASCEQNQIYSGFAEAEYLRHSQSTIFLCQSAAGGGCVGRLWRLRAAALRVLTEERIFRNCILADLRSAGSHCKNSGSSDGSGASARSDRAQTAQILRDRSASAGGGTRYYSPCLIFWCFWIKTKARKKESKRIFFRSILRETILPLRLCVSCKERIYHLLSPKGGAKSVRREPPSDLIPPPVQCGDSCALCAMIIIRLRPHMAGLRPAGSHCESSG